VLLNSKRGGARQVDPSQAPSVSNQDEITTLNEIPGLAWDHILKGLRQNPYFTSATYDNFTWLVAVTTTAQ